MNQRHLTFGSGDAEGKRGSKPTTKKLYEIAVRQGFRCALSGLPLDPDTSVLDHINPMAEGGGDDAANLQWVDVRVNNAKGVMSNSEFIALCEAVATHCGARQAARRIV